MARHRLPAQTRDSAVARRSPAAQFVTSVNWFDPAAIRRQPIRATRGPALSIAVIAPLVFASSVSGEARRVAPPPPTSVAAPFTPVAVVAPATGLSGPAVVAAPREPVSLHVLAAAAPAPASAAAINSPTALGIPSTALAAYRNAEQKMTASDPGCGISWNVLAGIGRIESGHANGGMTDVHGTAVRPIYGPALYGTLPGNEVIVASSAAGGATYARAMGPMQFLPGTWAHYASDGDGDGVADPQNLYDSALTAARYLCSGNLNLRDPSQAMAAILRYNNSMPYARNVLGWAAAYATGVVPVDLPPIAGTAPPLGDTHLENAEGLGPGLPLNVHGLSPTDPMAQQSLIDLGQPPASDPRPLWPPQAPATQQPTNCTLICIGQPE
jgi:membrane-bound lytic murein transglycosylase B